MPSLPQMKVTPDLGSVPMAWWRETGAPGGALVRGRVRVEVRVGLGFGVRVRGLGRWIGFGIGLAAPSGRGRVANPIPVAPYPNLLP